MPRQPRRKSGTNVYHCIIRGINKQDIFLDRQDYFKFKKEIKLTQEIYSYKLYSYVLMSNHIHLQVKDEKENLNQFMKSLQIRYANYFNKKYNRTGHLFQDRFKSKTVEDLYYFLNILRYIHQNPVKARISKVDMYEWSSYKEYIYNKQDLISRKEKNFVLQLLSNNEKEALSRFMKINKELVKISDSKELLEYEIKNNLTDSEVIYWIKDKLEISNIQEIQNYDKEKRDKTIAKIKQIKGCSQKQISRILGINLRIIQRAKMAKEEPSLISQKI